MMPPWRPTPPPRGSPSDPDSSIAPALPIVRLQQTAGRLGHSFERRTDLPLVMARLVRAIYSSTYAATDGPDKPGHDDEDAPPARLNPPAVCCSTVMAGHVHLRGKIAAPVTS